MEVSFFCCIFAVQKIKKTFIMLDYTKLKMGEVITMFDEYDNTRIAIVNKVMGNHRLYTYVELDKETGDVFFEKYEPGVYHDLNKCVCRNSEDEEKDELYDAIGKYFTEEYDKDWNNHFTDSSYFDIQDYLLDVFCINVKEYDDDLIYPDFINEIHTYIWDKLCEAMGVPNTAENKPEMVNKQEFIERVCKYLYNNWQGDDFYMTDIIEGLRKDLEE